MRRSSKRGERPGTDGAARPSAKPVAARKPRAAKAAAKPAAVTPERPVSPRVAPQRKIPAAGYAAPDTRGGDPAASPAAELITTTIQAAAELAQIGMTVGRQTLQSMLERLPKP